jgi:hypothetical protein
MADKGYLATFVNALPQEIRYPIQQALFYLSDNLRLGDSPKATNFTWYQATGRTASVANTEFSIAHQLSVAPKWLIPVVDLTAIGSQLVPLTVSRAADSERIYLKSASTSVTFTVFLEP